jgi:dTDP-4-amino-4,6-dideoxygalactose transaminase
MEVAYTHALNGLSGKICPRRSITAPNRLETHNWDLIAAIPRCLGSSALEVLREQLRGLSGRHHIFFAPSGRCAIAQVLSAMPQREVVMPAFTCWTVKQAAAVAEKRVIYVDIQRNSLNATSANYASLARPGRILIPTHIFGIPTDIGQICELARDRGCFTIEDAAAAFPAWLGGRMLGTFGDVGIISFENSKRVPSFQGAAIIVNNEQAVDVPRLARHRVVPITNSVPVRDMLFNTIYNIATIPWLYGRFTLPRKLRFYMDKSSAETVAMPREEAGDKYYSRGFHPYQAVLVTRILKRMKDIRRHIEELASIYEDAFRETRVETLVPPGCDTAGLLRFPIAFPRGERGEILRTALKRGLVLDTNLELPLPDEAEIASFPNSSWAARNVLLLPLYRTLSTKRARDLALQVIQVEQEISAGNTRFPPSWAGH